VALQFGLPVREIVLLPIGGVAIMGRNPQKPLHELLIAIAGPAVNVLIIAALLPLLVVMGAWLGFWKMISIGQIILELHSRPVAMMLAILVHANAILVLFNMIPAFPLDGGRVLRAILGFRMPFFRATRIAATVGQVLAVVLGLWGLSQGNWLLAIIAFLIFQGAGAETAAAHAATVLATRRVGDAYNKHALWLRPDHRVSHVIDLLLTSYQPDFAVAHRGRLAGVVTREACSSGWRRPPAPPTPTLPRSCGRMCCGWTPG
jgi:Zn-dependent protease